MSSINELLEQLSKQVSTIGTGAPLTQAETDLGSVCTTLISVVKEQQKQIQALMRTTGELDSRTIGQMRFGGLPPGV